MNKIIYAILTISIIIFFAYRIKSNTLPGFTGQLPNVIINSHTISVEIADTLAEQIQGLSDKKDLCANCGMLFIFSDSQIRKFWMKNMNFPIDIVWIKEGKIVNISRNLQPEGENPANTYSSITPADHVLEINAGAADELNLKIGDALTYNF